MCVTENLLPTFTNINPHDPAVRNEPITIEYRKQLVKRQLKMKTEQVDLLEADLQTQYEDLRKLTRNQHEYNSFIIALQHQSTRAKEAARIRTTRKLNQLHRSGEIFLPEESNHFLNFSDYVPSDDEISLLNLGLNCHYQPKFNIMDKKVELETLYDSLMTLCKNEKIMINPNIKDQLIAEGTRQRSMQKNTIITVALKNAAKRLKNNPDITIRKADKSNIFVILNYSDYN